MVDSGIMVMLVSPPLAPPSDCLVAAKINSRLLMFSVPVWRCHSRAGVFLLAGDSGFLFHFGARTLETVRRQPWA